MTLRFYVVLAIYNLLLPFAFVLSFPGFVVKMVRRGNYKQDFFQRFGFYSAAARERFDTTRPIWVNAVSVGELLLAQKLIRKLKATAPGQPIVLSCTTSTGYEIARKHETIGYTSFYNPLDIYPAVWRAFHTVRPRQVVLVESQLWPNFLFETKRRGIPITVVNARLSPRSERRFKRWALFSRPLFEQLDQVQVQQEEDIDRWAGLGVPKDRILCTGSIKFDEEGNAKPEKQIEAFRTLLAQLRGNAQGPVILAASTHAGEEKFLGEAFLELRKTFPDAFYIAVPRHFERGHEVLADLEGLGFQPVMKTALDAEGAVIPPPSENCCLIVNTTGEQRAWFHLADLVLVGKSFLAAGGQNPIEPLAIGKPIIMGPHMQNFALLVAALVKAEGGRQIVDLDDLVPAMTELLNSPAQSAQLVTNGAKVLAVHQGAAQRSCEAVLRLGKASE